MINGEVVWFEVLRDSILIYKKFKICNLTKCDLRFEEFTGLDNATIGFEGQIIVVNLRSNGFKVRNMKFVISRI